MNKQSVKLPPWAVHSWCYQDDSLVERVVLNGFDSGEKAVIYWCASGGDERAVLLRCKRSTVTKYETVAEAVLATCPDMFFVNPYLLDGYATDPASVTNGCYQGLPNDTRNDAATDVKDALDQVDMYQEKGVLTPEHATRLRGRLSKSLDVTMVREANLDNRSEPSKKP